MITTTGEAVIALHEAARFVDRDFNDRDLADKIRLLANELDRKKEVNRERTVD